MGKGELVESAPVPEAPQTIRQNWIPFLTFFFLRVLSICCSVSARGKAKVECVRGDRADGGDGVRWIGGMRVSGVISYRRHVVSGTLSVERVGRVKPHGEEERMELAGWREGAGRARL